MSDQLAPPSPAPIQKLTMPEMDDSLWSVTSRGLCGDGGFAAETAIILTRDDMLRLEAVRRLVSGLKDHPAAVAKLIYPKGESRGGRS